MLVDVGGVGGEGGAYGGGRPREQALLREKARRVPLMYIQTSLEFRSAEEQLRFIECIVLVCDRNCAHQSSTIRI